METNAETWTPSKKQCKMNAWQDNISHKIDVSKELDADFNLPKIHLRSHWAQQIHRYGDLQQHSTERQEVAHKRTSRMVATPQIRISTTCQKYSLFNVACSASESAGSISKHSLSGGRPALPPPKSYLPVLILLPLSVPSHM